MTNTHLRLDIIPSQRMIVDGHLQSARSQQWSRLQPHQLPATVPGNRACCITKVAVNIWYQARNNRRPHRRHERRSTYCSIPPACDAISTAANRRSMSCTTGPSRKREPCRRFSLIFPGKSKVVDDYTEVGVEHTLSLIGKI